MKSVAITANGTNGIGINALNGIVNVMLVNIIHASKNETIIINKGAIMKEFESCADCWYAEHGDCSFGNEPCHKKIGICPYYQGVCGLNEEYVCYCSSDTNCEIRINHEKEQAKHETLTEKERQEINPELCAEGLRYILQKYNLFDYAETAVLVGSIILLRNKEDNYPYQHSDDLWKKQIIS